MEKEIKVVLVPIVFFQLIVQDVIKYSLCTHYLFHKVKGFGTWLKIILLFSQKGQFCFRALQKEFARQEDVVMLPGIPSIVRHHTTVYPNHREAFYVPARGQFTDSTTLAMGNTSTFLSAHADSAVPLQVSDRHTFIPEHPPRV